jgi:hypothetical protein
MHIICQWPYACSVKLSEESASYTSARNMEKLQMDYWINEDLIPHSKYGANVLQCK